MRYEEFKHTFEPCASQASRNSEPALFTQIMEETSAPSPRTALIVLNVDKSYTRREPSSEGNQNDTQFIELVPYLNPQRGALHVQMRRTIQMRECTVFCIPRIGLWLRP